MITHDGLRVLMMAEDDSRCCFGLFGPLIPTKYYENKTVCMFFQGASDGNARISRNISQKLKNKEKLDFKKSIF